ncbi:phage major tail tube protein [uncultured Cetobacterium sp.]|uniref:phage major tail tube protein n=1 Tax=uncultured Cetobacterium sp. TaxID=527638 RepID=UPI002634CB87|nr:phage major tail tube protein [uncultured Cetobacterium sp.]
MIPSLIQECAVKINGSEKIVGVSSFQLPDISFKEEEINVLGLGGYKEVIKSMPEAMTTTMKFLGVDKTGLKLTAGKKINLILAAVIQKEDDEKIGEIGLYVTIKGSIKSHKFGEVAQNGKLEPEIEINLSYFKLEIDKEIIYEIDQKNTVLIVEGEDLRAGINAIIG